jgi:hypothetical protein
MVLQTGIMSYGGSGTTISIPGLTPGGRPQPTSPPEAPAPSNGHYTVANRVERPFRPVQPSSNGHAGCGCGGGSHAVCQCDDKPAGPPDFKSMTSEQRLAYHRRRIAGILGEH